ncbi:MAG: protein kinase [Alphaproteobacteria bacterium]|nr:protein kinase [Alphaproteobacteria bacterium]MCB9792209.1 protein kinase [Alphaproteobacteria bacterium]
MRIGPGRQLDRFQVERLLGSGGGADTWAVRDLQGARYALKLPHPHVRLSERLLREGRLQSLMAHPNLLPVLEVLELAGRPALLMPLIEGPPLDALLALQRPGRAEALALLRGVVSGVTHAHAQGLVHRDLKPANVLLKPDGAGFTPVVADFGVAKPALPDGLRTGTGVMLGTPAYMAPEQLQDASRVDSRADLWSLGVLLYELLTGRLPFSAERLPELLRAWHAPLPLDGLDEEDAGLIAALLQVDPEARLPDGQTLLACLEALAAPPSPVDTLTEAARAWTPPPAPRLSLPDPPTDFVGRGAELTELSASLVAGPARLLTLTGPGGMGKTRLAIELARRSAAAWPGGVCFVDLSQAQDRADTLSALASALTLPPSADPVGQVGAALQARGRSLLVLDNLEQLLEAGVTALLEGWLEAAPALVLLATSRAPTRAAEERARPIRPLTPAEGEALFLQRARAARPDLQLGPEDVEALPRLLALLDGLPLAIELAAARCRSMRVAELIAHLDQRWRLLSSRSQALPARQRALRAALQGSWDLLDAEAQRALALLSVFEGGFSPEAAAAVLERDALDTHELLSELSELGLLQLHHGAAGPRGRLLFAVQRFAREQASAPGPAQLRHARFFAGLTLEERECQPEPYERLQPELGNLLLAARSAAAQGELSLAVEAARLAAQLAAGQGAPGATLAALDSLLSLPALPPEGRLRLGLARLSLLRVTGQYSEARACAEALLPLPMPPARRAELLVDAARFALHLLDVEACEACLDEAAPLAERLGDLWLLARLDRVRALLCLQVNDATSALPLSQRAAARAGQAGDPRLELDARVAESIVLQRLGRPSEASAPVQRSLALAQALRRPEQELYAQSALGDLAWATGDVAACRAGWEQSRALSARLGLTPALRLNQVNLAALDFRQGRLEEAERALQASLSEAEKPGSTLDSLGLLTNLGYLRHRLGRSEEGLPLLEQAAAGARGQELRRLMPILNWQASALTDIGRFAEAEAVLDESLALVDPAQAPLWAGAAQDTLGVLRWHQGHLEQAEAALRTALSLHEAARQPHYHAVALCHLGGLRGDLGALAEAEALADQALVLCRRADIPVVAGHALSLRGLLRARQGDHEDAQRWLERAEQRLTPSRDQPELLLHELRCAEAALARGALPLARAFLKGAALRVESLGWRPEAWLRRRLQALEAESLSDNRLS